MKPTFVLPPKDNFDAILAMSRSIKRVCVTMIAHLLGREPQDVAEMVMAKREADDI